MDKIHIKPIGKVGSFIEVWLVDGFYIRSNIEGGIEFTNFGHHGTFPFIPENEFWIDEYPEDTFERELFMQHLTLESSLMLYCPYEQASYMADSEEAIRRLQNLRPEIRSPYIGRIGDMGGYDVHLVDGRYCRDIYDVDFTEGGNFMRYDWIPSPEIWIAAGDQSEDERKYTILHEITECDGMSTGMDYNTAHARASAVELVNRQEDMVKSDYCVSGAGQSSFEGFRDDGLPRKKSRGNEPSVAYGGGLFGMNPEFRGRSGEERVGFGRKGKREGLATTEKAVYPGNMGFVEMHQLIRNAPPELAGKFMGTVNAGKYKDAIKMLEGYHRIKFDPSIYGKHLAPSKKNPMKRRWQSDPSYHFAARMLGFDPEKGKRGILKGEKKMRHIIIQKAYVETYYRNRKGKHERVMGHPRHVVTVVKDTERLKMAREMGAAAFSAGKSSAPAQNKEFLDTFIKPGAEVGSSSSAMKEYIRGWHEANLKTTPRDVEEFTALSIKFANSKKLIDEGIRVTTSALGMGGSDLTFSARMASTEMGHYLEDLPELIDIVPKEEMKFLMQILEQNNSVAYQKVNEYLKKPRPLRKGKFFGFRMRKQELGEEEEKRGRKERSDSGEWTPSQERMSERAKQRKEDYGG